MFIIVKLWADNNSWFDIISQNKDIFQGNFIKTILRILNLLKNIETIAITFNNINNKGSIYISFENKEMFDNEIK